MNSVIYRAVLGVVISGLLMGGAPAALGQTPASTAFTYQGQLGNNGSVLNGTADFQFTLFDAQAGGNVVGATIPVNGVAVADGLFTVPLDFGAASFNGQALWLEIAVRSPAGSGAFMTLSPRQALTGAPFSLATRGINVDQYGNVGIRTATPTRPLQLVAQAYGFQHLDPASNNDITTYVDSGGGWIGTVNDSPLNFYTHDSYPQMTLLQNGNFGIGTSNPAALLHVSNSGDSVVRIDSVSGNSKMTLTTLGQMDWHVGIDRTDGGKLKIGPAIDFDSEALVIGSDSSVGIGTSSPQARLDVKGRTYVDPANFGGAPTISLAVGDTDTGLNSGGDGLLEFYSNNINTMTVRNGNVGIGTSTPGARLDLSNTVQSSERLRLSGQEFYQPGNTSASGLSFLLGVNRTTNRQLWIADSDRLARNSTNPMIRISPGTGIDALATDGTTALNLALQSNGGRVGIGTTTPSSTLTVNGTVSASDAIVSGWVTATNSQFGYVGAATSSGNAIYASSSSGYPAIYGGSSASSVDGIYGESNSSTGDGAGVAGYEGSPNGWGLYSIGDSGASGLKLFHIDHPLDPTRKYLNHYSAEGPEPYDVYSGSVTTNQNGVGWVELPRYFEALNRDYRYQLTVADTSDDSFVQAKVWREISGNRFAIRTSAPNIKVFWQVTGVRNDPAARRSIAAKAVEQDKVGDAIGHYIEPELYGQPREMAEHQPRIAPPPAPPVAEPKPATDSNPQSSDTFEPTIESEGVPSGGPMSDQ